MGPSDPLGDWAPLDQLHSCLALDPACPAAAAVPLPPAAPYVSPARLHRVSLKARCCCCDVAPQAAAGGV